MYVILLTDKSEDLYINKNRLYGSYVNFIYIEYIIVRIRPGLYRFFFIFTL